MMEQFKEPRNLTAEEQLLDQLQQANRKIERLEKIVGALAVTNFLTQHEDGDEEVRDQSVEKVNEYAYRFKQDWKTEKQIAELEEQKRQLDDKINGLKWGTLTYKTAGRYATALGSTIITNQVGHMPVVDIQQERMNAFNAAAAQAEAAAICNGSK